MEDTRWAQEQANSRQHFTVKSVTKSTWNPPMENIYSTFSKMYDSILQLMIFWTILEPKTLQGLFSI